MAHTAPEGNSSDLTDFLHLIKFGYGIWTLSEMAALVFHAERSIGKNSDRHSQHQAVHGIRAKNGDGWIRGPSGISKGAWVKANAGLVRTGIVARTRRPDQYGKYGVSEYAVNWPSVVAAIHKWTADGHAVTSSADGHAVTSSADGHAVTNAAGGGHGMTNATKRRPDGHAVTIQSTDLTDSTYTVRHSLLDRESIAFTVEQATGERVRTDGLTTQILEEGDKYHFCLEVVGRFIHDFCHERRGQGYKVTPGLIPRAVREDILAWARKKENQNFIEESERRAALARRKEPGVQALAISSTPEFGKDLVREIMARKKGNSA